MYNLCVVGDKVDSPYHHVPYPPIATLGIPALGSVTLHRLFKVLIAVTDDRH